MTPLVLIPGMMCDARLFGPQVDAFSKDYHLIFASITEEASVTKLAERVLSQSPEHFAVAGLSMGGIVAMEMLRIAPERIERIALMDTNPMAETEQVKAGRIPQMMAVREGRLASVMRDEMKPKYLAPGPGRKDVLDLCMKMALDIGPHAFLRQSRALMDRPDQSETLRGSTVPSLILCGRYDKLCPITRHEYMASLMPHAAFEVIEDAGHLPTLENPNATNQALARWLEAA
ncbi:alpha/beta hydrolase [Cognatishimia sp. D5M38]|uniref:Alpha/beta hydrolase n=1 Tax=Cognatishimia coralii TaxID=3083254 RepID=A0ABU8QID4_9RHOB